MEASDWTLSGLISSSTTYICYSASILGGYQIMNQNGYMERIYTGLASHNIVYFNIKVNLIDHFVSPDTALFQIGAKSFTMGDLGVDYGTFNSSVCGSSSSNDLTYGYEIGKAFHTGDSITIRITSNVARSPSVASFGIRDVSLLFTNSSAGEAESYCFSLAPGYSTNVSSGCSCTTGSYPSPNNSSQCLSCDTSCFTCFGPSSNQCYACNFKNGYSYINGQCIKCDASCLGCFGPSPTQCLRCFTGSWTRWDYTCSTSCSSPTTSQVTVGSVRICRVPCTSAQFYYLNNNTCRGTCSSPFNQRTTVFGTFCDLPCPSSQLYDWNGHCRTDCATPLLQKNVSGYLTCSLPCGSSDYLYWNASCISTCNFPLINTNQSGLLICSLPCPNGQYLYWNNSCISTCNPPFVFHNQSGVLACSPPCANSEYLYWNNSCLKSCKLPLIAKNSSQLSTCSLPCASNKFLYWNSSCLQICNPPFVFKNESMYLTCNSPCANNEFLYWNSSCLPACKYPLIGTNEHSLLTCSLPCASNKFLYENGSCLLTCGPPYYIKSNEFYNICAQNRSVQVQRNNYQTILMLKGVGDITMSVATFTASMLGSHNPSTNTIAGFIKILPYLRYMRIKYPPKLQFMLDNLDSSFLSFEIGFRVPKSLEDKLTQYPLPANFAKYQLSSSFLVNYWQTLTSLLILFCFLILVVLLARYLRKNERYYHLLQQIILIFKWNFILLVFCTNIDRIVLPTSLELRTLHLNSIPNNLSFVFCIIVNFIAIGTFSLIVYIFRDMRRSRRLICSEKSMQHTEQKWRNYQILFKGFKSDKIIQHGFMFSTLLRFYLFYIVISYFFEQPLTQSILITMLSLMLLVFMLKERPFTSKIVFAQNVLNEITMMIINLSLVTLAVLDYKEVEAEKLRETFGDVIIYSNLWLSLMSSIFLICFLAAGVRHAYKTTKLRGTKGVVSWLLVFLSAYQGEETDIDIILDHEKSKISDEKKERSMSPPLIRLAGFTPSLKKSIYFNHSESPRVHLDHKDDVLELGSRMTTQREFIRMFPSPKTSTIISDQRLQHISTQSFNSFSPSKPSMAFNFIETPLERSSLARRCRLARKPSYLKESVKRDSRKRKTLIESSFSNQRSSLEKKRYTDEPEE